ncbi:mucin-associated surface protein (MASP) [Trypanosoma cruzi]|nr:mucin-associated surface protein (MASP) [Trypanosoma cruzi]
MCRHTVDGKAHSAAFWAGECKSAARWPTRSCGVFVWKRFRRKQRRADLLDEEGTPPPTQRVACDPQGACRPVEERAGVASRLCGDPPLGHDVRVNTRNRVLATPKSARHAVCAPSFSSWNFFQYGRLTAVRRPTCQALTQSCGRDRAMMEPASAVTLRGIPQCHGENVEPTVRPRSTSESGTVQISSVTSSCTASSPRRSVSIAERESVAAGTRVGVWNAAAGRGTGNCLRPCSVAGHSARQKHARLPAAAR